MKGQNHVTILSLLWRFTNDPGSTHAKCRMDGDTDYEYKCCMT